MPPSEDGSQAGAEAVSPRDYATFIYQIELTSIWLRHARLTNQHGPSTPEKGVFEFPADAHWEAQPGGFRAYHAYTVTLKGPDATLAELDVTFALDFASTQPMTDAIFQVFREVNLPVNSWPYLREFVATTLGRFGWEPFTIPAFKLGDRPPAKPRPARRAGGRRTRRQTSET